MENGKGCVMCKYFKYGQHSNYDEYEIIHRYDGYCMDENNNVSEYQSRSVCFNDYCGGFIDRLEQPKPSIDPHQKTLDDPGVNVEINQS